MTTGTPGSSLAAAGRAMVLPMEHHLQYRASGSCSRQHLHEANMSGGPSVTCPHRNILRSDSRPSQKVCFMAPGLQEVAFSSVILFLTGVDVLKGINAETPGATPLHPPPPSDVAGHWAV